MSKINIIHGDCMEAMKAMPDKAYEDKKQMVRKSNELQIGKAGEYLVCADLILAEIDMRILKGTRIEIICTCSECAKPTIDVPDFFKELFK